MKDEEKREVNVDSEVLDGKNYEENDEVETEEEDEEVIPPQDDEVEDKKPEEEAEDAPESSPEEEPLKEEKSSQEAKPVAGETAVELARRKEIERLRAENRELRRKGLNLNIQHKDDKNKSVEDLLAEGYSEDEIKRLDKVFDVMAEKKGYVKKSQTYQDSANQTLDDFIESHPEYKAENDNDDLRWTRFQEVLASDYNIANKTTKQLKGIFEKVHRDVESDLGEPVIVKEEKKINAQRQKIQSVSHAGGTKTAAKSEKKELDPSVKKMFQGFDDDDLL